MFIMTVLKQILAFIVITNTVTGVVTANSGTGVGAKLTAIGMLNYTRVPVKWAGEIVEGKGEQTIIGDTLEHVFNQIQAINPNFNGGKNVTTTADQFLTKRDFCQFCGTDYPNHINCNRNPPLAYARGISGGYKTIFNKGGICKIPADFPHNSEYPPCNFIFCHGGSGVLFCRTDNTDNEVSIPCSEIAYYAMHIVEHCCPVGADSDNCDGTGKDNNNRINGVKYRDDGANYHVIVHGVDC